MFIYSHICAHVHTYTSTYIAYIHTGVHVWAYTNIHIYTHVHTCVHGYICAFIFIHPHTSARTYKHTHTHARIYTIMHAHMQTYIPTYLFAYIHTLHTHIHCTWRLQTRAVYAWHGEVYIWQCIHAVYILHTRTTRHGAAWSRRGMAKVADEGERQCITPVGSLGPLSTTHHNGASSWGLMGSTFSKA